MGAFLQLAKACSSHSPERPIISVLVAAVASRPVRPFKKMGCLTARVTSLALPVSLPSVRVAELPIRAA